MSGINKKESENLTTKTHTNSATKQPGVLSQNNVLSEFGSDVMPVVHN